jgi:hypothetical protein
MMTSRPCRQLIKVWLASAAMFAPQVLSAQTDIRFTATTDADKIIVGGVAEVSFELVNARGANFAAPSFEGLEVLSGPSTSYQTSIRNGVTRTSMSYIYTVQGLEPGRVTIGVASIRVGNQTLSTKPIVLQVIESADADPESSADANQFYIEMELSDSVAFPGQQLSLSYVLFTQVDVEGFDILSEPDLRDFYLSPIRSFDRSERRTVINGRPYTKRTLRQITFYPQKTGVYNLQPATIRIGVPDKSSRRRSFFFSVTIKPYTIRTNAANLEVHSLPPDVPETFTGAIGDYTARFALENPVIEGDESLGLQILLAGDGDANRISPPTLLLSDAEFELFDPKMVHSDIKLIDWKPVEYKTFEYLAIPKKKGSFPVIPVFTYFDPDSTAFITLSDTLIVTVSSEPTPLAMVDTSRGGSSDIHFIKTSTSLRPIPSNPFERPGTWAMLGLPVLGFLLVVMYKMRLNFLEKMDPASAQRKHIHKNTLQKLDDLTEMGDPDHREFYSNLSKILREFVSVRTGLKQDQIDKSHLEESIEDAGLRDNIIEVLKTCELSVYANAPDSRRTTLVDMVRDIVNRL